MAYECTEYIQYEHMKAAPNSQPRSNAYENFITLCIVKQITPHKGLVESYVKRSATYIYKLVL